MPLAIARIDTRQAGAAEAIEQLRRKLAPTGDVVSEAGRKKTIEVFGVPLAPAEVVERICSDVRTRGLEAVLDYTAKFDKVKLSADTLRVPAQELAAAHAKAGPTFLGDRPPHPREHPPLPNGDPPPRRADRDAARRLPAAALLAARAGRHLRARRCGRVSVDGADDGRAGPSGRRRARSRSSRRRRSSARTTTTCLATCHELGIREVYRIGGAQAVAALAYGVTGLAGGPLVKVDKIVGPGNLFVALAKKHVFGDVGIDSIAGPSEVIVVADETTPATFVASDLIAQAEHAPGSSVLITWSQPLWDAVAAELGRATRDARARRPWPASRSKRSGR